MLFTVVLRSLQNVEFVFCVLWRLDIMTVYAWYFRLLSKYLDLDMGFDIHIFNTGTSGKFKSCQELPGNSHHNK